MRHKARDSGSKYALLLLLCLHIGLLFAKRLDTNLPFHRIRKYSDSSVHTLSDLLRIFFPPWRVDLRWPNTRALLMQFSTCTRISKTNMPSTERSFYMILNTHTICVIFLYNYMQCVDGFSILLQRCITKGNDAKNPAIFSFCLLPKEPVKEPS